MTATASGGPFVTRRNARPATAWRKPGRGLPTRTSAPPSPAPAAPTAGDEGRSQGGGFSLLEAFMTHTIFGLVMAGMLYAYSSMVEARRTAPAPVAAPAATAQPMTPGLAARMVREASPAAFEYCYGAIERAGWPSAATTAEAGVARRVAIAECLRGN